MRSDEWLRQATHTLRGADIGSARLDCLVLLEDATARDRAWLLAHPEFEIPDSLLDALNKKIARRKQHIPLAYIRGWTEFYGRRFTVDERVLEPRPESETMIDLFKQLELETQSIVADVGTGSGALAVSAALERPDHQYIATDIDQDCLAVARQNADRLRATVDFRQTDLLQDIDQANVVLANLPYVPDNYAINQAAMNEPRLAIFGGPDGLDLYRRMFLQTLAMQAPPLYVLCESLPPHHGTLYRIAEAAGYRQHAEQDFIQLFQRRIDGKPARLITRSVQPQV